MSGGKYGRGKAPERTCLGVDLWPEADRRLWLDSQMPGDILSGEYGARSRHAGISNRKAAKGYGRWLTYLTLNCPDCLIEPPADRITPDRVRAYVLVLTALANSTQTIQGRLQELGEVARVVGPGNDWDFIHKIAARIRARHQPARDKRHLKLSDELLQLGLKLMDQAQTMAGTRAAILYRDGLIITFLALVPLRRRNLTGLRLEHNLLKSGPHWMIALDAPETKTHGVMELPWPALLVERLETYLAQYRPHLCALTGRWTAPIDGAFWVSSDGSPMTEMAIYDRVRKHSAQAFGKALSPHLFRDAAATMLAIADPEHVRVAAPVLGHRTFSTTEKYYRQAESLLAHRHFIDVIHGKDKK